MMDTSRRALLRLSAIVPFLAAAAGVRSSQADSYPFGSSRENALDISAAAHTDLMRYPGMRMQGTEKIAMICYDGMTMLDLVGPQYFFASLMGAKVYLVAKDPELRPIKGDTGFAIVPDTTFESCPEDLDVLFVGGGTSGTLAFMEDSVSIDFVADRGSRAKHLTSVCTGSLILGQAGLLEGKRATSHWATRHLLPYFGATEVNARCVADGNLLTAAGVSAGLDFALTLVAKLRGKAYAQALQLQAEYSPEPPFQGGTLEEAEPELGTTVHNMFAPTLFAMKQAAEHRRR